MVVFVSGRILHSCGLANKTPVRGVEKYFLSHVQRVPAVLQPCGDKRQRPAVNGAGGSVTFRSFTRQRLGTLAGWREAGIHGGTDQALQTASLISLAVCQVIYCRLKGHREGKED